jgi:TorA maturation chaperone TorD
MEELELRLTGEAMLCGVLGELLCAEPDFEWLDRLIRAGLFDSIPTTIKTKESHLGLGLLRNWQERQKDGLDCQEYERLRKDYFYLFQGVGIPKATIWESVYFTHDRTLFSQRTLQVRSYYERYGLQIKQKNHEPDDHLGLEMQFISQLTTRALEAIQRGDATEAEVILKDRRSFIECHPLTWVEMWCGAVQENAETDFYKGIACLCVYILKAALS